MAVSAAVLQGKGSRKRSVSFTDAGMDSADVLRRGLDYEPDGALTILSANRPARALRGRFALPSDRARGIIIMIIIISSSSSSSSTQRSARWAVDEMHVFQKKVFSPWPEASFQVYFNATTHVVKLKCKNKALA